MFPVGLTAALQHGQGRPAAHRVQSALMLWAIAFDDLLDSGRSSGAQVKEVLKECELLTSPRWESVAGSVEVTRALRHLRVELCLAPRWADVSDVWCSEFAAFLRASSLERSFSLTDRWSQGDLLLDLYLEHAQHSIALPWLLVGGMAFEQDPKVFKSLPLLSALAVQCGRAARLSNDIATHSREKTEGRLNAVSLLHAARGARSSRNEDLIRDSVNAVDVRLRREAAKARELAASISTDSGTEDRFIDVMTLGIEIYARSDFRVMAGDALPPQGRSPGSREARTPDV